MVVFIAMPVYMMIVMPAAGGFGPTVWVGLINRLFLAAIVRMVGVRRLARGAAAGGVRFAWPMMCPASVR